MYVSITNDKPTIVIITAVNSPLVDTHLGKKVLTYYTYPAGLVGWYRVYLVSYTQNTVGLVV